MSKSDVISKGGEVSGSRGSLGVVLQCHGITPKFLKECTTRQTHQDGQRLFEAFGYGALLDKLPLNPRKVFLESSVARLREFALAWLNRQHLRITCDRAHSPLAWIEALIAAARERSGGKVEQHLVGAKLSRRHPAHKIANHPGHAGDEQTGRGGDFIVGGTCYHVTAAPGRAVIEKCAANLAQGLLPALVVPANQVAKARHLSEDMGLEQRILVVSLEDFIALNVVEMAEGDPRGFQRVLSEIVASYNERLAAVETDLSLKIELQ